MKRVQLLGQSPATSLLVMSRISSRQPAKVRDDRLSFGNAINTNLPDNAWCKDLLGPPGPYPKEFLDLDTVYPRIGEVAEPGHNFVESSAPGGSIGHFSSKREYHEWRRFFAGAKYSNLSGI